MHLSARSTARFALAALALSAAAGWVYFSSTAQRRGGEGGFHDITEESGIDFRMAFLPTEQGEKFKINFYDHGCGLVVGDYDGDGHDDVYFLNQLGANALYRNRGDGTFTRVTSDSSELALADRICVGGTFGDFDNDGDQDLFVTSTRGGNVLFENSGNGRFREITEQAGVHCVAHSHTAAFFDYDADGDLDLYVTNTAQWTTDEFDEINRYYMGPKFLFDHPDRPDFLESNILYRNNGDRTFTDVTQEAGLAGNGWSGDVAVFDADNDGDQDVFVTHMFGLSQLYLNDGQGHFDDATLTALQRTSYGAIGSKAFDFNNDGRLDLFVADMHSDMWMDYDEPELMQPTRKFRYLLGPKPDLDPAVMAKEKNSAETLNLRYDVLLFGNSLFRNEGGGRFAEVSDAAHMETFWPWGVTTGDFNNDRYEDVFLPSGMGYPYFYRPSYLMMNQANGTFADEAARRGIEPPRGGTLLPQPIGGQPATRSSRCAATADFDGDGRLDLMVNNFNDRPYYFKNEFAPRHYIAFRLTGTRSNRDAIGAVVRIFHGDQQQVRQVHCAGGYLSQSSKTLHFGLGDWDGIDFAEIAWPSGARQTIDRPEINRLHLVTEPDAPARQAGG